MIATQVWTKRGVVLDKGGSDPHESQQVSSPSVLFEAGQYRMWYSGTDGSSLSWILHATSADGVTWTKHGTVFSPGLAGEEEQVNHQYVLKDGSVYKMWYSGYDGHNYRIFLATSLDGLAWTRQGMVMNLGSPGSPDDFYVYDPFVIKEGTLYRMWYSGNDGVNNRIMYTESTDGISWGARTVSLDLGPAGSLEDWHVDYPYVLVEGGGYHLWYTGNDSIKDRVFYAVSSDGRAWTRVGKVMDVSPFGSSDDWNVIAPFIIHLPGKSCQMWYAGRGGAGNLKIHYATMNPIAIPIQTDVGFYLDNIAPADLIGLDTILVNDTATVEAQVSWTAGPRGSHRLFAVIDPSGNVTETNETNNIAFMDFVVLNHPPVPDAGGPYFAPEGGQVIFDASGSHDLDNDTLLYRWDFANDGIPDTPWLSNTSYAHIYGDDFVGQVTLYVNDGFDVRMDTTDVTISNVLPSGSLDIVSAQREGSVIVFTARVTDPGSDDLFLAWTWGYGAPDEYSTYYNNGVSPDPYPSPDVNPRDITDTKNHIYGDNGAFVVTVFVRDDDSGGQGITLQITATPDNLPPSVQIGGNTTIDEGQSVSLTATATDPGSDDLTFSWSFELGPSMDNVYYNDGIGPDPANSPGGTYPFTATDTATHVYGDDGAYTVNLTVTDDDGGSVTSSVQVIVTNLPPSITPFGPFELNEADPLSITASAVDPGSDDLTFTWTFDYGPTFQNIHYNDGIGPDPVKSPDGVFPFNASDMVSHIYGDDGAFAITLTVTDDDGGMAAHQTAVTVLNVPPTIVDAEAFMLADITLRVAGEKWHDVILKLYVDGNETGYAQVVRYPGSPDDQSATLHDVEVSLSRTFSMIAYYTPDDDPINGQPNGANPAWITIGWENGIETRLHHTFNVQHPDTWVWTVDNLHVYAVNQIIHLRATTTDPGSDDLTFTWDSGDGRTLTSIYYNDGVGPDPYPSPEVNPMTVTDEQSLVYDLAGSYTITLAVTLDDGGSVVTSLTITVG